MSDKAFYQQVVDELNAGSLDPALWAMMWTKAGGDENKAKANYVERRVAELRSRARQTWREQLRERWKYELQGVRNALPWGKGFLWLAANALYFFWCYHRPSDTGFLAYVGAFVGFTAVPLVVALVLWCLFIRKPASALKIGGVVFVAMAGLMLLLNVIDVSNQYHLEQPHIYPFTLGKDIPASIGSDKELTGKEYANAVTDFNDQWEQAAKDHLQTMADRENGGWKYWSAQFNQGFRVPLSNALCPHWHKSTDLTLRLPPWAMEEKSE